MRRFLAGLFPQARSGLDNVQIQRRPPPSTIETANEMVRLARRAHGDWSVRQLATRIVSGISEKDYRSEALAIYNFCRQFMRYTRDPRKHELVRDPEAMVREINAYGKAAIDCDDCSVLIGSLCAAVGVPIRFTTIGFDPRRSHFHIFCEAQVPGGRLMLDPVAGPKMRSMARKVRTAHFFPI